MNYKLWGNLILLALPYSDVFAAEATTLQKAELVIGINGKNAEVRPCLRSLQNCSIVISEVNAPCLSQPGSITIKNNSRIIAKNIQAFSTNPYFTSYVVTNNSCPTELYPNNSCVISFNTNSAASFSISNILVKGTNTTVTHFDMQAIVCTPSTTTLTTGQPMVQLCTQNTGGFPAEISISNEGANPAIGLNAIVNSPDLGITIINNTCPASLAPGDTCGLSFSPGNVGGNTSSQISGSNTNILSIELSQIAC
ncbi:MAG: hypothetical protein P4L79_01570 [Legionella sp.]|uniref:hypothetical protein n=1 Tax=Legionella sp. TaxID=459 RepID=UPI00283BC668|nr:hypothetical protein [Legionella sp.]